MLLVSLAWILVPTACYPGPAPPTVQAPAGTFVGNTSIPDLEQFLGIPYAKPPVEALRFADPEPADELTSNPFEATAYGPGCLQDPLFADYNGLSEDCLTLNVIRPHACEKSNLPVMFWIHGGGNINGQSLYYNGTALTQFAASIDQPVIYVSINYRLGGFGFLTSPDFVAAGLSNLGLKDQYLALQWVHENIESFGGDPAKVMIFGESAGAWDCWAQLHHAYTQDEANKYFRGMVTQSGAPGSPTFPQAFEPETGVDQYNELLTAAGCDSAEDAEARIDCLREAPVGNISDLLTTGGVIDFTLDDDWFSKNLTDALTDGEMAALPIIHGANLNEGSVFLPDPFNPPNRTGLVDHVTESLEVWSSDVDSSLSDAIVDVYLNTSATELGRGFDADTTAPDAFWPAVGLYSDTTFHLGRRALLRKASASVPAWGYHFNQQPPLSQLNLSYEYPGYSQDFARRIGVQHGAELSYVFGEATSLAGRTAGDDHVSIAIMRAWISFAWTLDPNGAGVPEWPVYNASESGSVMVFAEQGGETIGSQPDVQRQGVYDVWNAARDALGLLAIY